MNESVRSGWGSPRIPPNSNLKAYTLVELVFPTPFWSPEILLSGLTQNPPFVSSEKVYSLRSHQEQPTAWHQMISPTCWSSTHHMYMLAMMWNLRPVSCFDRYGLVSGGQPTCPLCDAVFPTQTGRTRAFGAAQLLSPRRRRHTEPTPTQRTTWRTACA